MTLVIDTVGKITLPSGETCQGVILTSDDPADIRAAAHHWAGRVRIVPVEDDQEPEPLDAETVAQRQADYEQSLVDAGRGHLVAQ